jgi:hypothetical protein
VPVIASIESVEELDKSSFALEANDRIQVRHSLQNFGMVEARVVAANGDVGRYPALV